MIQRFFLTASILLCFCIIAKTQVVAIQKLDPKTHQAILGKRKVVLAKGIVTDIKVNKPSNVQMILKRATNAGVNKKNESGKKTTEDNGWICTQEFVDQTNSSDNIALSPLGGEIYPGLIFSPEAFHSGTYQKISQYSRKPFKLTIDGNCFAEKNISNPTEQNIGSAVNQLREQLKSKDCGIIAQSFYGKEILSEEDLIVNTAAAGSYMGISAKMNCNFESKSKSYKYLVDYTAPYYSIQTALDINAGNVFHLTTDGGTASNPIAPEAIDPNWIYVKSVTYGKRLLVIIESNEDLEKVGVFAEGNADYGVFSASATTDFKKQSALTQTTVRLFAIGGNQIGGNFAGMEVDAIKNAVKNYLTSTDKNYQPLSFKLKTIDDELVLMQLTSEYTSRKCIPKTSTFRITWTGVQVEKATDGGGKEDVTAKVKVRAYDKSNNGIPDKDNKVPASYYVMDKQQSLPSPVTFTFGSESNPKTIPQSENIPDVFGSNKPKVTFAFPNDDYNGKIVITSSVTEIDDFGDDVFGCGGSFTVKISDAPQGQYKIRCTHEGSIINLFFTIEPIYQQ
jgi:thiol-activated cytolysin